MEAQIVAAMIAALAKVAPWMFDKYSKDLESKKVTNEEKKLTEEEIEESVAEHYETFKDLISDASMRILKCLEDGEQRRVEELCRILYPNLKFDSPSDDNLKHEFHYRLRFLEVIGVLRGTAIYRITPVGEAFLHLARRRKNYNEVLSG